MDGAEKKRGLAGLYRKSQQIPVLRNITSYVYRNTGILVGLVILCLFLSFGTETFATQTNIINILRQISTNVCLTVGIMLAILLGGIDLTGGAVIALSGCISAKAVMDLGTPVWAAIFLGCLAGLVVGMANGLIIAYTDMPPFIVTLAMQNICRGAAYLYADGNPIRVSNEAFEKIGMGYLGSIPLPVIYSIVILAVSAWLLTQTKMGQEIYAVGGNREAARFTGININRVQIFVYSYSGLLAGVAGVVLAARMASGQPATGVGYETDAVAAAVLGGTSMSGGVGTPGGMIIGILVIGVLNNGLNLLHVNSFWQYVARGVVILLAVYVDLMRKRRAYR
ncbi:MAG: ABC transporter permease [Eubacteriales bacterium]|nr:ABC transporter permease [Eubacteriales bacterium]